MKTVKQVAEEIGVSKQAIHKRIKKEPLSTSLQRFITMVDRTIYISVDGEKLIKSMFEESSMSTDADNHTQNYIQNPDNQADNHTYTDNHTDNITTKFIKSLQEQIGTLIHQNNEYRGQIKKLEDIVITTNNKLLELLDRQQELLDQQQKLQLISSNNFKNTFLKRLFQKKAN